jgi:hypothetical protein
MTGIEIKAFHPENAFIPRGGSFGVGDVHYQVIDGIDFNRHGLSGCFEGIDRDVQ